MRLQTLDLLICPASGGKLSLEAQRQDGDWVEEGRLVSVANGQHYPIINGMPHLYVDDDHWAPKAREAAGWVNFHKDRQIYDQTGVPIDFQLPYFPHEPWIEIGHQFDISLDIMQPKPGMRVLDLGAGRGWAAKHFAKRGCDVVAIEVNPDEHVGLGRANALMQEANVRFDAVIGDSENLPFAPNSFDVVFAAAALHHTSNLELLLRNVHRVLKPSGRLIAMNEPCTADTRSDAELDAVLAEERAYGINENHPRLDDYRRVLKGANLVTQRLFAWNTYTLNLEQLASWSVELGIKPPSAFADPPSWLQRITGQTKATSEALLRERWMEHLMRQKGAGLIIVAGKG